MMRLKKSSMAWVLSGPGYRGEPLRMSRSLTVMDGPAVLALAADLQHVLHTLV